MNQIIFDNVATFSDWGIYLSSLSIDDAEPKEHYVNIPSGDGSIDLTESLTGEVSYRNRMFEAEFTIKPTREGWSDLLRHIRAYLNGQKRVIRIVDDPNYYLVGRCKTSFEKDGVLGILTVTATCEPWWYKNELTKHELTIGAGDLPIGLINSRKRVLPTITSDSEITLQFDGNTIAISEGSHRFTNIILSEGNNSMVLSGPEGAKVTFEYQEGTL